MKTLEQMEEFEANRMSQEMCDYDLLRKKAKEMGIHMSQTSEESRALREELGDKGYDENFRRVLELMCPEHGTREQEPWPENDEEEDQKL